MRWDSIEGNWKHYQGKARQRWGKRTDADLTVIKGRRERLEGRHQTHDGNAKEKVQAEVGHGMGNVSHCAK